MFSAISIKCQKNSWNGKTFGRPKFLTETFSDKKNLKVFVLNVMYCSIYIFKEGPNK